jgi:hypothetical protein
MRLKHLYLIPWDIQDGTYLNFYNGRVDPRFSTIVEGKLVECDLEFVGDSFQLPLEGHGFLSQKDPLSERKPLFFQVNKNILLARQIKILKLNKGILRNLEAIEGLNTSD